MKKITVTAGTFTQKYRTLYTKENGLGCQSVTAVAKGENGCFYIGTECGLFLLENDIITCVSADLKISTLYPCSCGKLFAGCGNVLYEIVDNKAVKSAEFDSAVVKICKDDNGLWLATPDSIYRYQNDEFVYYSDIEYGGVTDMTVFGNRRIYCASRMGVMTMHGKRPHWSRLSFLTCDLPECRVNTVANDDNGYLWIGTDKGVFLYDGYSKWYSSDDLPYLAKGEITSISIGKNGTRYISTTYGLVIQTGAKDSVLTSGRWLPYGKITAVAASDDGKTVLVGTENGLSKIEFKETTLKAKADYLQQLLDKYYCREGYFTYCVLEKENDMTSAKPPVTDNDGLFTGIYLGTQALRYAVTGEEEAKRNCDTAAKALLKLQSITGLSGFTARAYRRPNEDGYGDGYHEFHAASDEIGTLEWRGETSSDEMVGHFFGLSLYCDLVANDEQKAEITDSLCKIVDHAIEHNGMLFDIDGLPTTWAHWGPDELNRDDVRYNERGVNSLEYLMMIKVAYVLSGDKKYGDYYDFLIKKEHYAINAARHKVEDKHVMHIDDNLCFLSSLTLFRYENDAHTRQILLMGLRHHWEYEKIERAPLWNIAYGSITGEFCELENAVRSLEELPVDMICYETRNSDRPDIVWDEGQELFDGGLQMVKPLPYDENKLTNFDGNPFIADSGKNGNTRAMNPHIYLLPYWLGRYSGMIAED